MWPNQQETADLVTFAEEILNWKLHFLCSVIVDKSSLELEGCVSYTIRQTFLSRSRENTYRCKWPATLQWFHSFAVCDPMRKSCASWFLALFFLVFAFQSYRLILLLFRVLVLSLWEVVNVIVVSLCGKAVCLNEVN